MKLLKNKISLTLFCAVLSTFTLLAYHAPFFKVVFENSDNSLNGVLIRGGLVVIMVALNFLIYYLLLFAGRIVGRCILAISFIGNAMTLYFIDSYEVLVTDKMMGNVFNTQYSEASAYFSWQTVLYLLFLGVAPCIYLFWRKVEYGTLKRAAANIGIALVVVASMVFANFKNFTWIDKNATQIGSLLMPWSYVVNSVRYYNSVKKMNEKEILLPDAKIATQSKDLCVLVIGESARSDHFSLLGYDRKTNTLLESDDRPRSEVGCNLHHRRRKGYPRPQGNLEAIRDTAKLPIPHGGRCIVAHLELGRATTTYRALLQSRRGAKAALSRGR